MQETQVWSLVWENPTWSRAAKSVCHNYWVCPLEPGSRNYWAHVLQLLKPAMRVKSESCLVVSDSLPRQAPSSVHGVLQTRILEWVAFPFSRGSSRPTDQTCISCMQADSLLSELPKNPRETTAKSPNTATREWPLLAPTRGKSVQQWRPSRAKNK